MTTNNHNLLARLRFTAAEPNLLVACDFDGTISAISSEPGDASVVEEAQRALELLATMDQTVVAVVSGRALEDLRQRVGLSMPVHLVGSHGSEFDLDEAYTLDPKLEAQRAALNDRATSIAATCRHASAEFKPSGVAVHYRNCDDRQRHEIIELLELWLREEPALHCIVGKMVHEISFVRLDKGAALDRLRHLFGAQTIVYFGDDTTDETVFARLRGQDVGIKVGEGSTLAQFRVADPTEVAHLLGHLTEARSDWLRGATAVPIEQHSLIANRLQQALIDPTGAVVWMCAPRQDSCALFASLLGGTEAGLWSIRSTDPNAKATQRYGDGSLVLTTEWDDFSVVDYFNTNATTTETSHLVRVISGNGTVRIDFAPRFDYGRAPTVIETTSSGLRCIGDSDPLDLLAPTLPWNIERHGMHDTAWCEVQLDSEPIVLRLVSSSHIETVTANVSEPEARQDTMAHWRSFTASLTLPQHFHTAVARSAIILGGLATYEGAILAASTTSLPADIGGSRNWDYRYCWPRDAAMTARALCALHHTDTARAFLDWFAPIVEREQHDGRNLNPLYALSGRRVPTEAVIYELHGYAGSRPVRVGNAAQHQLQLDAFAPVAELIADLAQLGEATQRDLDLLTALVEIVAQRWQESDHGIWEMRREPTHYVSSKTMTWVTVDRGMRAFDACGLTVPSQWPTLADTIRNEVIELGVSASSGYFAMAYDIDSLDASTLLVGIKGLIPPNDPRFVATVDAVVAELCVDSTVRRYLCDDGLPGHDGGFHICTGWLIESLALIGKYDAAAELTAKLIERCGPTGLLSEGYEPTSKRAVGNVPQAYSHLAIIMAALALDANDSRGSDRYRT